MSDTSPTIKALMVDDDDAQHFLVKQLMREFQFVDIDLDWAESYDHALEMQADKEYSLYLVDYRLGHMSGLELVTELIARDNRHLSSYILLTGYSDREIEDQALKVGVDDFIPKDELSASLLERTIRYTLEQKKNLHELENSRNLYKQLYLNTNTPVLEVSLEYDVLKINSAFNRTFKFSEDYQIEDGHKSAKIWDVLGCKPIMEKLKAYIQDKKSRTAEVFECQNQEGETLLVQMNVYGLVSADNTVTYQIVLNDLTERIKKDRREQQQRRLELMEKMARIAAHEVRNPLSNIVLSSEQLEDFTDKEGSTFLDIIKRNAVRIELLIKRFLNTFRQGEMRKELSSVEDLLEECLEQFSDQVKLTSVSLNSKVDADIPPIQLDREKVILVLNNLVHNAIQACKEVADASITVKAHEDSGHLILEVVDNGVGISNEDMANLFEPFFTKKPTGLGLGLTTALRIIQSHGGDIVAKQNPDRGATFVLTLPY